MISSITIAFVDDCALKTWRQQLEEKKKWTEVKEGNMSGLCLNQEVPCNATNNDHQLWRKYESGQVWHCAGVSRAGLTSDLLWRSVFLVLPRYWTGGVFFEFVENKDHTSCAPTLYRDGPSLVGVWQLHLQSCWFRRCCFRCWRFEWIACVDL